MANNEQPDRDLWEVMEINNPRHLPRHVISTIVSAERCAKCLGRLEPSLKCVDCGEDWRVWILASTELNNRACNRREG